MAKLKWVNSFSSQTSEPSTNDTESPAKDKSSQMPLRSVNSWSSQTSEPSTMDIESSVKNKTSQSPLRSVNSFSSQTSEPSADGKSPKSSLRWINSFSSQTPLIKKPLKWVNSFSSQTSEPSTEDKPPKLSFKWMPSFSRQTSDLSAKVKPSKLLLWKADWFTDWWGLEILSWGLAALSLLSIITALESHKNKPVPEWPLGITINALISTLATIGQMAMMQPVVECISQLKWLWFIRKERLSAFQTFDDASRGPTGSLILIGKLRGSHLACLGAAITIISIAFGPFAQQVVSYPQRLHPVGISTTPQVMSYTGAGDIGNTPSPEILSAVIQGFGKDTQTLSTITPSCTSGNCTWGSYQSLGVCYSVTDISSSLIQSTCNQTIVDGYIEDMTGAPNPGYPCFNWTLPAQHVLTLPDWQKITENISLTNSVGQEILSADGNLTTYLETMLLIAATTDMPNQTFMTGYLLYQPGFYTSANTSLPPPIAYQLTLDFCLQNLTTTVKGGNTTTVIESSQPLGLASFQTGLFDDSGNNISDSQGTIYEGSDFGFSEEGVTLLRPALWAVIEDSCLQELNISNSDNPTFSCGLSSGTSFLNPLFINPNASPEDRLSVIDSIMQNIAISLTNVFRVGAGNDTLVTNFEGIAYAPIPYVDAQYEWLILPIGLVGLTLVFLLATIFKSHRLGARVLKSSNYATLQGLTSELHNILGEVSNISEMEQKAEKVKVVFNSKPERGSEHGLVHVRELMDEKYLLA